MTLKKILAVMAVVYLVSWRTLNCGLEPYPSHGKAPNETFNFYPSSSWIMFDDLWRARELVNQLSPEDRKRYGVRIRKQIRDRDGNRVVIETEIPIK